MEEGMERDVATFHGFFATGMGDNVVMRQLHTLLCQKRVEFMQHLSMLCTITYLSVYLKAPFWSFAECFLTHLSVLKEMLHIVRGFLKGSTLWRARCNIKEN